MNGGLNYHNILYQDPELRIEIDLIYNPPQHALFLYTGDYTNELKFDIPIGCLEEIAKTSRDRLEETVRRSLGDSVVDNCISRSLTLDSLGVAISQAYILELERRTKEYEERKKVG